MAEGSGTCTRHNTQNKVGLKGSLYKNLEHWRSRNKNLTACLPYAAPHNFHIRVKREE